MTASVYQLVKIPLSLNVSIDVRASSIDEVRRFAIENVDTSTRWVIKLDGRNLGEAIEVVKYRFDDCSMKVKKQTFNSTQRRIGYFDTPEEAVADYQSFKEEASKRLDIVEARLKALKAELGFELSYAMYGDTHGIHEDYLYVSVTIGGYDYRRQIE